MLAHVAVRSRQFSIEYEWIAGPGAAPLLVFLHEGLGSVAMWRDWPRMLCRAGGFRGLVYSRPGYGHSSPRSRDEKWPVDYMHSQAIDVLPAFLHAVGIDTQSEPPWLIGHSDGASIALIHAAAFPQRVAGLVALAPHVFVEDLSIKSIERAREVYVTTDTHTPGLAVKLGRYHRDPDSAFWGWNDVWLDPAFRAWNIEDWLQSIAKPVLAVQGEDDEYGTMAQLDSITMHVPHAQILTLADCGHSPQRDQPQRVIEATLEFIERHSPRRLPK
ncbi:MAG: alpha/beta hydrolase [Burkholderiaceae bacterium]